jgi:ABC-type antimicrobial peptide transport system permease subunit
MEPKGQFLGFDIDDCAYIPVAAARQMFNREALQEIDLLIANASFIEPVVARIKTVLTERHNHEEDFTVATQTLHLYVPALPVHTPMVYVALALIVSLGVGLASGLMPARRAAALDPVVALTVE